MLFQVRETATLICIVVVWKNREIQQHLYSNPAVLFNYSKSLFILRTAVIWSLKGILPSGQSLTVNKDPLDEHADDGRFVDNSLLSSAFHWFINKRT